MGRSTPDIHKKIGKKIRETRLNLGLSLEELSLKTGFSVSMLSALELGDRRIHIDALYTIAKALKVDAADLLAYDEEDDSKDSDIIIDKQFNNLAHEWEKDDRKKEAVILLREFRNLTPDQIHMLIETVKTFKK